MKQAAVAKSVTAIASKAIGSNPLRVRVSPAAHVPAENLKTLAYIIGAALGDGNLSNPNGRAVKLRITCDTKYPRLIQRIKERLEIIFLQNKVSILVRPRNCVDVIVHSNKLESLLGWNAKLGSKFSQGAHVPDWIKNDKQYVIPCLRGLFETDGSVYLDRGYLMTMFVTVIPDLAKDVASMIESIDFISHTYKINPKRGGDQKLPRYNIRVSKNVQQFIKEVGIDKR